MGENTTPQLTRREFFRKIRDVGKKAVATYGLFVVMPPGLRRLIPDAFDPERQDGVQPVKSPIDGKLFVPDPSTMEVTPSLVSVCRTAKESLTKPGMDKLIDKVIILDQNDPKFPTRSDNCLRGNSCYGPMVESEKPIAICTFSPEGKAVIYLANSPIINLFHLYHEEGHAIDPLACPAAHKEVVFLGEETQLPKEVLAYNADFTKRFEAYMRADWLTYDPDLHIQNDPYLAGIMLGRATDLGKLYPALYAGDSQYNREMLTGIDLIRTYYLDPKKFIDNPQWSAAKSDVEQVLREIHDTLRVEEWAQVYALSKFDRSKAETDYPLALKAQDTVLHMIALPG